MNISQIKTSILFTVLLNVFGYSVLFSQSANQTIYSAAGSYTFTVPSCISVITVETWGSGGGGGSNSDDTDGGGGGGGGAYSRSTFTVTPGTTYSVTVGAGGAPNTNGQTSIFADMSGTTLVSAFGGSAGSGTGSPGVGGAGGTTGGVGQVRFPGGAGGNSIVNAWSMGGGGGSSAGYSQNGRSGSTPVTFDYSFGYPGGAAPVGGAQGGTGGANSADCGTGYPRYHTVAQNGYPGGGGGGGGSENNSPSTRAGANGGDGKVVVSYGPVKTESTVGVNSDTWTCPVGITRLLAEVWGAGGGGGGNTLNTGSGGAGGGGAYSETEIVVSAGQIYNITIGGGGSAGQPTGTNGGKGGSSWVELGGIYYALAEGGYGGQSNNNGRVGGSGGLASNGTGNFKYSGGNGGNGYTDDFGCGGGGGSSAGYNANGSNGLNGNNSGGGCLNYGGAGGTAPSGGIDGAPGYSHWNYTYDGNGYGAGGAGGSENNNNGGSITQTGTGGKGGDGMIFLDWNPIWSLTSNAQGGGGTPIPAGNICSTGDVPIQSFGLQGHNLNTCVKNASFTGFQFTVSGTFQTSDIADFKLYWTTTPYFSTTNLLATITPATTATLQTFPAFNLSVDSTQLYFWVTANILAGSTDGRTIAVNQTIYSDLTLSRNVSRASLAGASGTQTIRKTSLNTTLTPPAICSGTTFTYTPGSAQPSPTFSWNRATVAGISPLSSSGTGSVSEVLTNTTSSPISVVYTYTTTSGGCSNNGQNVVVTVNPSPQLSSTLTPNPICSATAFTYTATSATTGSTFSWSRAPIAGISQAGTTGTGNVNETLTNTTTAPINVTYVYTTTANGCSGANQNVVVTVNPLPQLSSTLTPSPICSATTFTYTATSATTGSTFSWSRAPIAGISQAGTTGTGNVNETLTNTTTAPINVTYVYTTTANGCSGANQNVVVTVNPLPQLSSTLTPNPICSATAFTYTATSATTGSTFSWSRAPIAGISQAGTTGTGNVNETLTNTTTAPINVTYVYTTTANGCSGANQNVVVTVNPLPQLSSTLSPSPICSATAFTYTATSATTGSTFSWSRAPIAGISQAGTTGTGNVNETLTNTTTAPINVTYVYTTTANGCSGANQNVVVTVNPLPQLSSTLTPNPICSATAFTYTATSATTGSTFSWSRAPIAGISQAGTTGTGNVNETLTNTTTAPINVTYVYTTTANGCSGANQNVVVTVNPLPQLSSTLTPNPICSATAFTYTATSATTGSTFSWSRAPIAGISQAGTTGTGNVNETLTNTTTAPINVTYVYTTTANGCSGANQNVVVTVNPLPQLSSTLTPNPICSATAFTYTATSATTGSTFSWSRAPIAGISQAGTTGTGNVNETLTNTTTAPINVTYVYTTTANGCSGANQNVVVTVNPLPQLSSTLTPNPICSATAFTYTATSATTGSSFSWSRAPIAGISQAGTTGTDNVNETLTNTSLSTINVTYTYTTTANGCSGYDNVVVLVRPNPQGSFTGNSRCGGDPSSLGQLTWTATAGTDTFTVEYAPGTQSNVQSGVAFNVPAGTPTVDSTYTLTKVTDSYGCVRTSGFTVGTATITLTSLAIATNTNTPSSSTTCAGTTASFHVTASNVHAYNWEVSTDGGSTYTLITAPGAGPVYSNYTTATLQVANATTANNGYQYRAVLTPGCGTVTASSSAAVLTVNPVPVLTGSTGGVSTVCSGIVTYTASSSVPGSTYAWTRATVPGITQPGTSGTGNVSETLTNTTTSPIAVTYNYVTTSPDNCSNTGENVIITINPDANIVLTSATGTDNQHVCLNDVITPITYTINQGATNATLSGVPTGITGNYNSGVYTISGTANQEGVFTYTINTTGSCVQTSKTGTLTIGLTLLSGTATDTQYVCNNTPITNIVYAVGSSSVTVTGLPTGVTANFNSGILIINGTPTVDGTYNYTVNTTGSCTSYTNKVGMIVVGLGMANSSAPLNQNPCINTTIGNIVLNYSGTTPVITWNSIVGNATSGVNVQPAGITTGTVSGTNTYTIGGTPTASGTYEYTVSTAGCATVSVVTGTITVGIGQASISAPLNQNPCINTAIGNIVLNYSGTTPVITWNSIVGNATSGVNVQPAGITTGTVSGGNTYTIGGTPTASGTYEYTVSTAGCATVSVVTGTITVGIGQASISAPLNQNPCINTAIGNIILNYSGTTPVITWNSIVGNATSGVNVQPAGITTGTVSGGNTYTIGGTPTASGTYEYTVSTAGCATVSVVIGTITVGIGQASISAPLNQSPCINTAIGNIILNYSGTTPVITWNSIVGNATSGVNVQPAGITTGTVSGTNTYTIGGTPTASGTYEYTVSTAGCATVSVVTGTITVGIGQASISAPLNQNPCINTAIGNIILNYSGTTPVITWNSIVGNATSGVNVQPAGITTGTVSGGNTYTIGGTPTASGTYEYTVSTAGCATVSVVTGTITVGIGQASISAPLNQNPCINTAIGNIILNYSGTTPVITWNSIVGNATSGVNVKPAGITTGTVSGGNTYTIGGTPTASGTYEYTVSTAGCATVSVVTGTITVGIGQASISAPLNQSPCINTAIGNIVLNYSGTTPVITWNSIVGNATSGVNVQPAGITTGTVSGTNTYTIGGTPTASGTYEYTVSTAGCATVSVVTGTITVGIGQASISAPLNQNPCINTAIGNIILNYSGTTPVITWNSIVGNATSGVNVQPAGITTGTVSGTNTFTIGGTPTASGTYEYTVSTAGCATVSVVTGTITVGIGQASISAPLNQSPCINTAIGNIILNYSGTTPVITWNSIVGNATSGVNVQPAGITTGTVSGGNTYTIGGTPTASGTYEYTVNTAGCATVSVVTGTITVGIGQASISAPLNQSPCINTAIGNIILNYSGTTPVITWNSIVGNATSGVNVQPAGITTGTVSGTNTFTIGGTPTASGTYEYTVSTAGCATVSVVTGTITVGIGQASISAPLNQNPCINTAIGNIILNYSGTTPVITWNSIVGNATSGVNVQPAGITTGTVSGTNTYTIGGTPTASGTYEYTVSTAGCATVSVVTGTITVGIGQASISAPLNQNPCINTAIGNIILNYSGTTPVITWNSIVGNATSGVNVQPAGITTGTVSGGNTYTIGGTPTASGTYEYTVSTAGCATVSVVTGTITVGIGQASISAPLNQNPCINTAIGNIILNYSGTTPVITWNSIVGNATSGVNVQPAGITTGTVSGGNTYTIGGTPTASGTYEYTVSTAGCATVSVVTGTITVGIGQASISAPLNQNPCINTAIGNIILNYSGTTPVITWNSIVGNATSGVNVKPAGITTGTVSGTNTFTIGGTPTASGTYEYTVSTAGCATVSVVTGTITVGIGQASISAPLNQSPCINTAIGNIILNYSGTTPVITWNSIVGNATSGVNVKPAGITTGTVSGGNTYTIGGTPTASGTYEYTVTTTGCSTVSVVTGMIIVGIGQASISAPLNQSICKNTSLNTIVLNVSGATPTIIWSPTGLNPPAGVTSGLNTATTYTIGGTPTVPGIFNYTVTTSGTCQFPSSLSGRIIVNIDSITLQPGNNLNQQICSKDAILPISFSISGTATTATVSGGLNISNTNNIYTVTGTPPPAEGIYTYTVTTSGTCGAQGIASITFTIQVVAPVASFSSDVVTGAPPLNVNFTNTSTGSATAYNWDFGDGNTSTSNAINLSNYYTKEGIYTVVLKASVETSNAVCWDTATTRLLIYKLTIPNVFTPNGDGKNDVFTIKSVIVANLKGEIFDRWGTKLYEWNSAAGGWDGRNASTGMLYPDGTYYFIITLTDINGVNTLEKGYLELIH